MFGDGVIYTGTYAGFLGTLKDYLAGFSNLQTVGRNGLHKYNNQDHSMLTAMLAVRNLLGEQHDVWTVNTERSYHEEIRLPHDALSSDEAGVEYGGWNETKTGRGWSSATGPALLVYVVTP